MTSREMLELATAINTPVVQRYLTHLAQNSIKDIVHAVRKDGESAESFLERVSAVKGGLVAIELLLEIEPPTQALV